MSNEVKASQQDPIPTIQASEGETESKYWGKVTVLETGPRYRISRVEVKPGHRMMTQVHYHRSEHWIVVSGTAKVVCNNKETLVMPNQSTYVPSCTPHHVENPGVIPLVMIEVQNGDYLGDDDTVRLSDEEAANWKLANH